MTRVIVYASGFLAFVAATAMTVSAILLPNWISFHTSLSPLDDIRIEYGLYRACYSLNGSCRPFPEPEDCKSSDGRYFCNLWRTAGFLMGLAAVLEFATILVYVLILVGGKQKRQTGWKTLSTTLFLTAAAQCAAMAIVAYCYDNDVRFFIGWRLDKSWVLCTVSWCVAILSAAFITLSACIFPPEDGYESIPSERRYSRR